VATAAVATAAADAARLHAANTAGAAFGALAAGFWLLPALGLRGTTWVGVSLNIAAAAGALIIASGAATRAAEEAPSQREGGDKPRTAKGKARPAAATGFKSLGLATTATAISGFSALVYEVAWTRLITMVIGPTTYAFAT